MGASQSLSHPLPRLPLSWLMAEAQRFPSAKQLRTMREPPHTHPEGNPLPTHNKQEKSATASWALSPEPAADNRRAGGHPDFKIGGAPPLSQMR